jgi:hypothetical protein
MGSILKELGATGMKFDENIAYWIPRDLSVTFGTVFDNIRKWIKNDLKDIVEFKHEFVDTQLMGDKGFFWTSGILGQARKPVLNLQFNVDHLHEHPSYGVGYSFSARESANYLPKGAQFRVMAFEDDKDSKNNLDIRIAFKSVHINCHAGIVEVSRPKMNNIAHYWHTVRQPNEQVYDFRQYVDFQIPTQVLNMLIKRFNLEGFNHHQMLRFLNLNSFVNVYYGMSGYDGKFYYFLRYPVKSFIKTSGMTNPEPWGEEGIMVPEAYTIERDFEIDVMVPMFLSFSAYGDRIVLDDNETEITDEWRDINIEEAAGSINERFIEIERVFKERHAISEMKFTWSKEDLITHPSGTVTTKKISLEPFLDLDNNKYLQALVNWARKKNYKYSDLFNFQLYQNPGYTLETIQEKSPLRKPIDTEEKNQETAVIPKDNKEYEYYLKNMEDFFIVDFKPDLNRELYGIVYLSLAIRNQFEYETNNAGETSFANDDLGFSTGYGHSKSNETTNKW